MEPNQISQEVGEKVQQLRALAVIAEDLGLVPGTLDESTSSPTSVQSKHTMHGHTYTQILMHDK